MIQRSTTLKQVNRTLSLCLLLFAGGVATCAQSIDASAPAPIRSSNLQGRISARDLGDSRLTDHFYAFKGTPGDLLITVQSRNLNGDIDVFTAGTLRPLLKLTIYAESTAPVTKGIYLRRREDLILRIEARSPNDDDGTYEFTFSGSFEPIAGGPDIAEADATTPTTPAVSVPGKKGRRVSSVGARIDEPVPAPVEVAAAPTPEPTPEATPTESPSPKASDKEKPAKPPATRTQPQSARSRRPASRRNTPVPKPKAKPAEGAKADDTKKEESSAGEPTTESTATRPKSTPSNRSNTRRSGTTARAAKTQPPTPTEPQPEIGPRLIIETNDGTLINRSMGTVRRVTVENGQIVVVGKDGKIDRILLANVVRMQIQP